MVRNAFRVFSVYLYDYCLLPPWWRQAAQAAEILALLPRHRRQEPLERNRPSANACSWKPGLHKRSRRFWTPAVTSTIQMQATLSWIQWKPWEHRSQPKRPSKGCQ